MKRDYELIQKILLEVEKNNGRRLHYNIPDEAYHCDIMIQAGLLQGNSHLICPDSHNRGVITRKVDIIDLT